VIELLPVIQYGGFGLALVLAGLLSWVVKAVIGDLRRELHDHTEVSRQMHLVLSEVATLLRRQNHHPS